jgi:diguanylate cyclase (GGDEF)-like protein/PAS domain S-box-containing protein
MLKVLSCLRDQHDPRLIVLAGLVCGVSIAAAVFLLRQTRASRDAARRRWLAVTGVATGFGIWATHFIAMLGYDPGVVAGYDAVATLLSLLVAVSLTTAGFGLSIIERRPLLAMSGGAVVGAGVAAMHYLGMSAVQVPGVFAWDAGYVVASIAFAVVLATPAVRWAGRARSPRGTVGAGVVLALAILSLHFTGMAALTVIPTGEAVASNLLLSPVVMGVTICVAAVAVLALCLIAAILSGRAEAAIRANEREFRILVQGITDCALYMLDTSGRVASWNAGAQRLKGYTAEEAIGLELQQFYSEAERAAGAPAAALATALRDGKFTAAGWRYRKDGSCFWAHAAIEPVFDEDGVHHGFAKITRDMTQYKEDQDRLAGLTQNLDAALSNMHQGLCMFDADERLILTNRRVEEIFRLRPDDCPTGTPFKETIRVVLERRAGVAIDDATLDEVYARHRACIAQPDGGSMVADFTDDCTLSIVHRPTPGGGWVSTYEDITDRRRAESRIAHMALHDSLTGLPNREFFNERLELDLQHAERNRARVAAIAIDLDRFKEINDIRGHAAGDEVLKVLSDRMGRILGEGEFVARFGGDEFAAVKTYGEAGELSDFVERLEACLFEPFELDGFDIAPAASLGIAVFPEDGATYEQLLNNADLAMYRAKATLGQSTCFYEPRMDESARERRKLAKDLRAALGNNEFTLAYQVQRSVLDQEITGYEALLRWTHPTEGSISPADFIPIAEESGAILEIGEWVLRTACADAARWDKPYKVAVNLSPVQLAHVDLIGLVTQVLVETGLSPSRLELEITETAIIGDKTRALHILRGVKALGVTIAIDDFGTGYSSLDTLNSFPFDKIKIDRSFLMEAAESPQARAIIRAILALGRSLQVPVLAEGVESESQLALLKSEGCDEAQGYLFGRPAPLEPAELERDDIAIAS